MSTAHELSGERARRAVARLPDSALADLRDAFAGEVAERLPRLRQAAASGDPEGLRGAQRDVHTLGSSAYIVGAVDAARTAREAEEALLAGAAPERFRALVEELAALLSGWLR